jgi:hypothetical protein
MKPLRIFFKGIGIILFLAIVFLIIASVLATLTDYWWRLEPESARL